MLWGVGKRQGSRGQGARGKIKSYLSPLLLGSLPLMPDAQLDIYWLFIFG
ncbi:hypothetical protein COO91_05308 [Nostoc flagelliforme CCNUN1]|uniref:Uncharacterized protein n=1 Tax=Nostoc flagelliforme CCNUN1 TaxID=2038116 RepID=A0A2K8SV18_9NOSO|nr:hypothetical protein COO91_05308 [Nostoc flagelliforme CCNUN1]